MLITPDLLTQLPDSGSPRPHLNTMIAYLRELLSTAVLDMDLTAPPGAPDDGERHIIGESASGLWSGHDLQIAEWKDADAEWLFFEPFEPKLTWVISEQALFAFYEDAWHPVGGDATPTGTGFRHVTDGVEDAATKLIEYADLHAALAAVLDGKAPLASPTFTGTPSGPTAAPGTNTTQYSTTAFVAAALAALVDSSPGTLDTLNELAAALGDDPNFSTTVTNAIAAKQDKTDTLTTEATLADDDVVAGYDTSATAHRKFALSSIFARLLAAARTVSALWTFAANITIRPAANAIARLILNVNGTADDGSANNADILFCDTDANVADTTAAFRFLAAFGNASGNRYGGFWCNKDRDGNRLPFYIYTQNASNALTLGFQVDHSANAGQIAPGTALRLPEIAAPATPASGNVVVYAKSDGKVYRKDDAGTEAELGGASSGNATSLQGRALASSAPSDGQAVVWDNAGNTWKPGTVSGGGASGSSLRRAVYRYSR